MLEIIIINDPKETSKFSADLAFSENNEILAKTAMQTIICLNYIIQLDKIIILWGMHRFLGVC